nr:translin-associated protein X isoform X1 [Ipomoea batatas]
MEDAATPVIGGVRNISHSCSAPPSMSAACQEAVADYPLRVLRGTISMEVRAVTISVDAKERLTTWRKQSLIGCADSPVIKPDADSSRRRLRQGGPSDWACVPDIRKSDPKAATHRSEPLKSDRLSVLRPKRHMFLGSSSSATYFNFFIRLMASNKSQRVRYLGETSWQTAMKKARTMTTSAAADTHMKDAFSKYTDYLNGLSSSEQLKFATEFSGTYVDMNTILGNEKRERVVKASRDITMNSKKVIFQVHRMSKNNREEVLEKAEKDLDAVTAQYVSRLVKELQGTDFWKLRRAYSPGVQEYVEAATLCHFCKAGTLISLDELNANLTPLSDPSIEPLQINILDYLLGLADLTGELMRMAIGRISDGEVEFAHKICNFVREIHRELTLVAPLMEDSSDMKTKMDTMLQSVMKIENACFSVHVRGSEFVPFLESDDSSYPLLGVSDID